MKRFLALLLCILLAMIPMSGALAALDLPAQLQTIEAEAFAGDTSVSGVLTLPDSVKEIGDRAFAGTDLFALRIPAGVQTIGSGVVSDTGTLYVEIPSATAKLAGDALSGAKFLIAPEGSVSSAVSDDVVWLNADSVFTDDGFVYHYTTDARDAAVLLFPSAPGRSGEFVVPETAGGAAVVEIGDCAFYGLSSLEKVIVTDKVSLPKVHTGWAEDLEIEIIRTAIDPVLPDDDRAKTQFFFDEESLTLHPGEYFWLSPSEWPEGKWSGHSSSASVATIDESCYVEAHGLGDASLTIWVEDNDIFYYATITVHVVPYDVTIGADFEEITMPVGEIRTPYWDVVSSSDNPIFEYVFQSSDESVATHDDYGLVTAVAPGTATVTITILDPVSGEELASASATIHVVENRLTLNEAMIWAYDAFEYQLELLDEIPADATVAWSSTAESITVDSNGLFRTDSGEDGEGGRGLVVCTVTYADGSTATASCYVTHAPFDISFDTMDEPFVMLVNESANRPINAYILAFPPDLDKAVVTLTSADDSIVSTDGVRTMYAHKSGTVTMTLTLSFLGVEESTTFEVKVEAPRMEINLETEEIELSVDDSLRDIGCGYMCDTRIDRMTVISSDTNVVKSYLHGDRLHFVPVNAGKATVTITMGVGGETLSRTVSVTVTGCVISLSPDSVSLAVGESIQLTPVLQVGQEINYEDGYEFWSNDDSIVTVDGEGRVIALKAGTAVVYLETSVNGERARASCLVTVTDEEAALTLSHTTLHMAQGEQVQLTAYLNGEKVKGVWSTDDSGLHITQYGLATLRHNWPESHDSYITCTVETETETYTATCLVTGRASDVTLDCPSLLVMNVGDDEYVWANFSSNVEDEKYTVRVSSSDEYIAYVFEDSQKIRAAGTGVCTLTVELLDSKGEVVITRDCVVRVGVGVPELERMEFLRDVYFITTDDEIRPRTYLDPILEPLTVWDVGDVTITSSDESVVVIEGHDAIAVGAGVATLTMTHKAYPGVTDTATVYVVEPQFDISATEVQSGDTVTFTVNNLPAEGVQAITWGTDDSLMSRVGSTWNTLTVRTRNQGLASVYAQVDLPEFNVFYYYEFTITGESLQLNLSDLAIEPGHSEQLHPDFHAWDIVWSTSDDKVAVVDESGSVTAIAYGECDITASCQTENGPVTASCHVIVEDGEWTLLDADVPSVMIVGDVCHLMPIIESTHYAGPTQVIWDLGENSLLSKVEDDAYVATAPGLTTVTVTAIEGEQVETVTRTIRIVEPAVRLARTWLEVRPNLPVEMEFITAAGKEIKSVVWSVSNAEALTIDENNVLTANVGGGSYAATAQVTLDDDTTHTLSAVIRVIPDEEILVNVEPGDGIEITVTETGHLHVGIDTNALEEEVQITWNSANEDIAVIEKVEGFAGSSAIVRGAGEVGETSVLCTVKVGNLFYKEFTFPVTIHQPDLQIDLEHDEMRFSIGNSQDCGVWYGSNLPIDKLTITSDNTDVVRASILHDRVYLTAVGEGSATVTATISARGYSASDTMHVIVEGCSFSLSSSEATLNVGDTIQLSPVLSDGQQLDYNSRQYESSDPAIAYVNGDGLVTALKPGVVRIKLRAAINHQEAVAFCLVTVVDSECPLTLNASSISLACSQTFQLKALWNGAEISDAVWTSGNSGVIAGSNGLVYMHHTWTENDYTYVTASVERDGKTWTASCMITGKQPEITMDVQSSAIVLNVGDGHWLDVFFSSTSDIGPLTIRCLSSEESLLEVSDGQYLRALKAGTCSVTVQLVNEEGAVVCEQIVPVYISSELPALESISFCADTFCLDLNGNNRTNLDPRTLPLLYMQQGEMVITSSDEKVVFIDGYDVCAAGAGTATVSIYNTLAPDQVATATVHVYDWQVNVSNTEPGLNELITVTSTGLENASLIRLYCQTNEGQLRPVNSGDGTFAFRTMNPGEAWLSIHAELPDCHFERHIQINISGDEGSFWPLSMTDAYFEPGAAFDLWPEFNCDDQAWRSTDETVATVTEYGHVVVLAQGECDIILDCTVEGSPYSAVCHLHAADGQWTLKEVHMDDVVYVGSTYNFGYYIESTYNAWPKSITFDYTGDAVTRDGEYFTAVKPGVVTFTITASEGDQVETLTKTVTVVEPAVYLRSHYEVRPNLPQQLEFITAQGMEIASVVWSVSDNAALTVDERNVLTALAGDGSYIVSAQVTLTDGTTHNLSTGVRIIPDNEIGVNAYLHDDRAELTVTDTRDLHVQIDTNAWEEEVKFTWISDNEDILVIDETYGFANCAAVVRGEGEGGETTVRCILDVGNFYHNEFTFFVTVHPADVWIDLSHDQIDISIRENTFDVGCWYGNNLPIDTLTVVSSNPGVATVYMMHDRVYITPVSEGETTITATISARGYMHNDTMNVRIFGSRISLNVTEATMNVGDTLQLSPVVSDDQDLDYNDRYYDSSDPSIAYVNGDGMVTALKAGTVRIRLQTRVNNEDAVAWCTITVTDDTNPLTLNADRVSLAHGESFQLKALWNGEEISDAVWSVSDNSLIISNDGVVSMYHNRGETYSAYATATVVRDGETRTASCLINGREPEIVMVLESAIRLGVEDRYWVNPYFSTTEDLGELRINCISSNEAVVKVDEDKRSLIGVGAGEATVTVQLLTADDQVVIEKTTTVYVNAELPALESITFAFDEFILDIGPDGQSRAHTDPRALPRAYMDACNLIVTSDNENIVRVEGYELQAVSAGTTTISVCSPLAPEQVATATVYVYDWQIDVSNTTPVLDEMITVTMSGLEDAPLTRLNWRCDEGRLRFIGSENGVYTFRTINPGEVWLNFDAELYGHGFSKSIRFDISGEWDSFRHLNMTDARYEPSHEFDLWPEFECDDQVWSSTNTTIATVDEGGHVKVLAEGECEIILDCTVNGEPYTTVCRLQAADGQWTLKEVHLDDILYIGSSYRIGYYIENTYNAWPEHITLSADSDVVTLEDENIRVVKPGVVTITMTATEGDQVESLSKTVQVIAPAVCLEGSWHEVRPNLPYQLNLLTAEGKEIDSVVWTVSDSSALTIDENNVLTALAGEGSYIVSAQVTLTDGTVHMLSATISIFPDRDIYIDVNHNDWEELTVTETRELRLNINTNAWDEEIQLTWTSDNEDILVIDETHGYVNSVAVVRGVGEGGDTTVRCSLSIGSFFQQEYVFNVHVNSAGLWIDLEGDERHLYVRDGMQDCGCWYGYNLPYDALNVVSSNPDVVSVYMMHDRVYMTPVSEGEATITATISARGYSAFDTLSVRVYGSSISMNVAQATMNVGDTLQLSPVVGDGQNLDYNDRHYDSSDPSIAYVNGDGMVTALKAGTVRIRLQTRVNDEDAVAWCTITVTDDTNPLTLSAEHVRLAHGESCQLKALWNGVEINDAVWSADNSALLVSNSGVVTMYHNQGENFNAYVTATVERDGETWTASCLISGRQPEIVMDLIEATVIGVGERYWVNPYFSTTEDFGELHFNCISDNEAVVKVDEDKRSLIGVSAGEATVTVQLVTGDDQVLIEKTMTVYVEAELPALESISFSHDVYVLDAGSNGHQSEHTDPRALPRVYMDACDLIITSADEDIVRVQGYEIIAVAPGTTTISIHSPLAPEQVATATVHVYNWQVDVSNSTPGLGELITMAMSGLEDAPITGIHCNWDEWKLRSIETDDDSFAFRSINPGETWLEFHASLHDRELNKSIMITISGVEGEYLPLNMTDARYEPGREFDLWPEFECYDQVWSSSDTNIATVEQNGHVKVLAEGECEIILDCTANGEPYTTVCRLHVADGQWTLTRMHLEDVLYVGNTYNCGYDIDNTYNAWPDTVLPSVEGDALTLDGENMYAAKPGVVTVTLTATEGDQVEILSKTVLVVEPAVRMAVTNIDLRPGQSAELPIITGSGKEIADVRWSSNTEGALSFAQDNTVTALAGEGNHTAVASVTLTDGSVHQLTVQIHVISNDEVWLEMYMDEYREYNIFDPADLHLNLQTNAYEGEVDIEWSSSNESAVTVTKAESSFPGAAATLNICGAGSAEITCTVRIGDFLTETRTCFVQVRDFTFELRFYDDSRILELQNRDQDAGLHINTDNIGRDTLTVVSSNPDVVRVALFQDRVRMIPVSEGTATLTVTMVRRSMTVSDTLEVTVTGCTLEMAPGSVTLNAGDSTIVAPVLGDGQLMKQDARNFQSNNESVAIVDNDGVIHALSAGTAVITFETEVDYDAADGMDNYVFARGECIVTVIDDAYPLTLNATSLSLAYEEAFQLKALWNGVEIDDVTWSSTTPESITVSDSGVVYMSTEDTDQNYNRITATVVRDGQTYTATCLVSGKLAAERIDVREVFHMDVGGLNSLDASLFSTVEGEIYTLDVTSDNEAVARITDDKTHVEAVGPGVATLTFEMKNSSGTTVAARTSQVYVETDLPALERIGFKRDVFFLTVQSTTPENSYDYEDHVGPYTIPNSVRDICDVEITAADPSIVEVDGHWIHGLKAGSTTITLSHPMYPGQTATATVYVFDLNPTIEKTTINVGETSTLSVSLDGIPEEYVRSAYWVIEGDSVSYANGGWDTWTVRGRHASEIRINFHLELPERYIQREFYLTVEGEQYLLNDSDYCIEPGKAFHLDPWFECTDRVWHSTNGAVATVNADGFVNAIALGECDIVLTCLVNGETVTASCHVNVLDGEWHLTDIQLPDIIYLRDEHSPSVGLNNYYGAMPDSFTWSSSDSSILSFNEEAHRFCALKTGKVDVSVTATEGSQVETVTKTVYIVEPPVRLASANPGLRPGASETLELLTAAGRTVADVQWRVANPDMLSVTDEGLFTMSMDAIPGNTCSFTAVVTLDDGSVYTLRGWYYCIPSEYLEWDFRWEQDRASMELGYPASTSVFLWTNAAPYETYLNWHIEDESIARIGTPEGQCDTGIELIPVAPGMTRLFCTLDLGENGCYHSYTIDIEVEVTNSTRVSVVNPDVWLRPGASVQSEYEQISDLAIESVVWSAEDPNALSISDTGLITLLATEGDHAYSVTFTMADGAVITIPGYCHTVPDNEVYAHGSIYPDYQLDILAYDTDSISLTLDTNAAPHEIFVNWSCDSPDIIRIEDYEGQACMAVAIEAVGLGYATVFCEVVIGTGEEPIITQTFEVPVYSYDVGM